MVQEQGDIAQYDEEQMGAEQTEQLEDYVLAGYEIIYDESEAILKTANRADTITKVEDVANALLITGSKIDRSREQNGLPPFPDQVKVMGAYHLNDKIVEFAEHRGAKPFTEEEKQAALKSAIQKYMERGIKDGSIDPKELAVAAEQAQPGSISQSVAGMPDDVPGPLRERQRTPAVAPEGAPGGAEKPKGLLGGQPSPLERFLS